MSICDLFRAWREAFNAGNRTEADRLLLRLAEVAASIDRPEPGDVLRTALAGLSGDPTEADIVAVFKSQGDDLPDPPVGPLPVQTWDPDASIPDREWLIKNLLPAGRLASFYGIGGAGKSVLAMQIAHAIMHGGRPVALDPGLMPDMQTSVESDFRPVRPIEPIGRVMWLTWEDETAEILRRWRMMQAAGAIPADSRLDPRLFSLVDMRQVGGPLWSPLNRGGHISTVADWTPAGLQFLKSLSGHALAIIDPLAACYGSNENDRALVRAFTARIDGEAEAAGCAVMLIAHPSKSDAAGSGSTDWRGSVRSQLNLELAAGGHTVPTGDGEDRQRAANAWRLRHDKSNYGPSGSQLWLRRHWQPPSTDRPAELAWLATTAKRAAEAHEDQPCHPPAMTGRAKSRDRADAKGNGRAQTPFGMASNV